MRHLSRFEVWTSCIDEDGVVWSKKMCEVRLPQEQEHASAIQFLNDHEAGLLPEGEEVRCEPLLSFCFRIKARHDFAFDFILVSEASVGGRQG